MVKSIFPFLSSFFAVLLFMTGCSYHSEVWSKMDQADSLMWSRPDSSLSILKQIDIHSLNGKEEQARYALLMSMALDKNYIDTTDFKVLQPAIDFYLKSGKSDEKLRTFFYMGRIYENNGDWDNAMASLIDGQEVEGISDSLIYALLLTSKGRLYHLQYKNKEFAECNLKAAKIYHAYNRVESELKSYCRALNGFTMLGNQLYADSLMNICSLILTERPDLQYAVMAPLLMYTLQFGNKDQFYDQFNDIEPNDITDEIALVLSQGFSKYGDYNEALSLFAQVSANYQQEFPMKYYLTQTEILENLQRNEDALASYKNYVTSLDEYYSDMISRDLLFAEKKHDLEVANLIAEKAKQKHIYIFSLSALTMVLLLLFIYYHYSLAKANSLRKQAEVDRLEAVKMSLQKGNESLELKNRAAELELKQKELEMENLRLEISQAEEEQVRLKQLLEEKENQNPEVSRIIKERLSFLNGLIAKDITNNKDYADSYQEWIEHIRINQKEFMKSTRLILSVSHPEFIRYLEENNLTDDEINYVCLYAIGLRGKEIGEYIKLRRHYVISSAIRKKLGLDEHGRNLGPYIRELMENR